MLVVLTTLNNKTTFLSSINVSGFTDLDITTNIKVVYVCGSTPVKIVFRLHLQNLSPGVDPQTLARVGARGSMFEYRF